MKSQQCHPVKRRTVIDFISVQVQVGVKSGGVGGGGRPLSVLGCAKGI